MKKKVVILGAGESGIGAAILAKSQGFAVFLSDYGLIPAATKQTMNTGSHLKSAVTRRK